MTIQGEAVKLARKIREGLDKGVTESTILKSLNDSMKRIFASEQRKTRWQVGNTEAVKNALAKSDASWFKRAMQASMITNKVGDSARRAMIETGGKSAE